MGLSENAQDSFAPEMETDEGAPEERNGKSEQEGATEDRISFSR